MFHKLKQFFSVDWLSTLLLNFSYLPMKQACRLPILLYRADIKILRTGG